MHSNRDAKRIDRRRGREAVVSAQVNPQLSPAYSATTEKAFDARQLFLRSTRFGGWVTSTIKNHYTNDSVRGRAVFLRTSQVHCLTLLNEWTSNLKMIPKKNRPRHEGKLEHDSKSGRERGQIVFEGPTEVHVSLPARTPLVMWAFSYRLHWAPGRDSILNKLGFRGKNSSIHLAACRIFASQERASWFGPIDQDAITTQQGGFHDFPISHVAFSRHSVGFRKRRAFGAPRGSIA